MSQRDSNVQDSWLIGSRDDCDLRVAEPTVSGHHCRLTHQGNGFTVEDLGSTNGTFVNGVMIAPGDPVWVPHGANVTLGSRIQMPWPVAVSGSPPARPPSLLLPLPAAALKGGPSPSAGRRSPMCRSTCLSSVGTTPSSRMEDGQYILEDRNSRNGTSIGELSNRIQRAVLDPSDDVYLGSYKIAAAQLLSPETKVEIGEAAFHECHLPRQHMEIGRDPQCDIPLRVPHGLLASRPAYPRA